MYIASRNTQSNTNAQVSVETPKNRSTQYKRAHHFDEVGSSKHNDTPYLKSKTGKFDYVRGTTLSKLNKLKLVQQKFNTDISSCSSSDLSSN